MKEIHLNLAHNVFANVGKCLRVFSRLTSNIELLFRLGSSNASVGATTNNIPGGPERSAGSLGIAIVDCVAEAYLMDRPLARFLLVDSESKSSSDSAENDNTVYGNNCTLNNDPELGK